MAESANDRKKNVIAPQNKQNKNRKVMERLAHESVIFYHSEKKKKKPQETTGRSSKEEQGAGRTQPYPAPYNTTSYTEKKENKNPARIFTFTRIGISEIAVVGGKRNAFF